MFHAIKANCFEKEKYEQFYYPKNNKYPCMVHLKVESKTTVKFVYT